jgi:hypothetical protein
MLASSVVMFGPNSKGTVFFQCCTWYGKPTPVATVPGVSILIGCKTYMSHKGEIKVRLVVASKFVCNPYSDCVGGVLAGMFSI